MWYETTVFVRSYMGNFHPHKFGKYSFFDFFFWWFLLHETKMIKKCSFKASPLILPCILLKKTEVLHICYIDFLFFLDKYSQKLDARCRDTRYLAFLTLTMMFQVSNEAS